MEDGTSITTEFSSWLSDSKSTASRAAHWRRSVDTVTILRHRSAIAAAGSRAITFTSTSTVHVNGATGKLQLHATSARRTDLLSELGLRRDCTG
jgi:hypothetical protein